MFKIVDLTFFKCWWPGLCSTNSAVSRAVLKTAYRWEIPNARSQTLKSVDFCCKLSSPFVVAEPRERCFEQFKMQNSQNFSGLHPWTPLGKVYCTLLHLRLHCQPCQLHNAFSPCYISRTPGPHKKLTDRARTTWYYFFLYTYLYAGQYPYLFMEKLTGMSFSLCWFSKIGHHLHVCC